MWTKKLIHNNARGHEITSGLWCCGVLYVGTNISEVHTISILSMKIDIWQYKTTEHHTSFHSVIVEESKYDGSSLGPSTHIILLIFYFWMWCTRPDHCILGDITISHSSTDPFNRRSTCFHSRLHYRHLHSNTSVWKYSAHSFISLASGSAANAN